MLLHRPHLSLFCLGLILVALIMPETAQCAVYNDANVIVLNSKQLSRLPATSPGVVYRVRSSLNLQGRTINIPDGSTLTFEKGKIKNGVVVFHNNKLEGNVCIQSKFDGTLSNDVVYLDWFIKAKKKIKKLHDVSERVQSVFNLGSRKVVMGGGFYQFANIRIGKDVEIEGDGTIICPIVLDQKKYSFNFLKNVFYTQGAKSVIIRNIFFQSGLTGNILPDFKSETIYGEPLIFVDKAELVRIDGCKFKNIENCTYCSKAYNHYSKKQGSCVCLWDVSDASYVNCEQVNCRHDEQVWIIAVDKPIMETKVTYTGNYIHDMTPGPNSSAFTCVAGTCLMENNKVVRYSYPGSMFNVFAKKAIIRNNEIKDSYCSSVFDVCEYSYFYNDEILVENNHVDAINSALVLGQSARVSIKNNVFRGLGLYYSSNNRIHQSTKGYKYWYADYNGVLPTDVETVIDGNVCDFTGYDGNRSIAGIKADYGTGEILEAAKYNNVGVNYGCGILIHPNEAKAGNITITNNHFTSLQSLEGDSDKNNLAGIYPHAIRLVNTENVTIRGNTFNGCYRVVQNPDEFTCISIYNYPDVMEKMEKPGAISRNPSQYGKYVIEDNVFNVPEGKAFYLFSVYARTNATRQTELKFNELVVRNNSVLGNKTKAPLTRSASEDAVFKQNGPVKVMKQVIEKLTIMVKNMSITVRLNQFM